MTTKTAAPRPASEPPRPMIRQFVPGNLPAALRHANRAQFDAFIARDLRGRAGLNPRTSAVLYGSEFEFLYAMELGPHERQQVGLWHYTPVRFWSRGV